MKKVIIIEDSPTFCNMLGKEVGSEGMENNLMLQLQRWSESCEGIL